VNAAIQNLAQATIVSPINGTVVALGLATGKQVAAQSSTASVVIAGQGGFELATNVAVANIADVKLGDAASVLPDGTSQGLAGKVVWIGVAAATSGTSTTYPVVVGFSGSPAGLANGASATVTLQTSVATQALTVPSSAVHSVAGFHFVTTLNKGVVASTPVQIGAIGAERTEITGGLQAGQVVVLADMNAALPTANSTPTGGLGRIGVTGGGGFGGGAGFGGGGGFGGTGGFGGAGG
jgi:HlyD family secretion protein